MEQQDNQHDHQVIGRTCSNQLWFWQQSMQLIHGKEQQEFFLYVDVCHRRCLRIILGISWRDHMTNEELIRSTGMEDLSNIVRVRRFTLVGHILWLSSDRPASVDCVVMQWEHEGCKRRRWRPRKTWLQTDLQEMRVSWSSVHKVDSDRNRWKSLVAQCFERSWRI